MIAKHGVVRHFPLMAHRSSEAVASNGAWSVVIDLSEVSAIGCCLHIHGIRTPDVDPRPTLQAPGSSPAGND